MTTRKYRPWLGVLLLVAWAVLVFCASVWVAGQAFAGRFSDYPPPGELSAEDLMLITDVSDKTMADTGTTASKRIDAFMAAPPVVAGVLAAVHGQGAGVLYQPDCTTIPGGWCVDTDGNDGTVADFSIAAAGEDYLVDDELTLDGGESDAVLTVTEINVDGGITAATLSAPGTGYSLTTYSLTGGTGTGASVVVDTHGNAGAVYFYDGANVRAVPVDLLTGALANIQQQLDLKQDAGTAATKITAGTTEVGVESGLAYIDVSGARAVAATPAGLTTGNALYNAYLADGASSGNLYGGWTAGQEIDPGQAVVLNKITDQWVLADADADGLFPAEAVAVTTCAEDEPCRPMFFGFHRSSTYSFNRHDAICLGTTPGALVKCADPAGKIGVAIAADTIRFDSLGTGGGQTYVPPPEPDPEDVCASYIDNLTDAPSMSASENRRRSAYLSAERYVGFIFDDASTGQFCDIKWLLRSTGDLTGYDFYEEIWELDGDLKLSTMLGRSVAVDGANWADAGTAVLFVHSQPVAYDCTGTKKYARVIKRVADGDLASNPPIISTTNYFWVGIDPGADSMAGVEGVAHWQGPYASQALSIYGLNATDDPSCQIFTIQ